MGTWGNLFGRKGSTRTADDAASDGIPMPATARDLPEQRRHFRVMSTRPVKLFHLRTGRFLQATTVDISAGGICVQIDWPSNVFSGDRVDIYLPGANTIILREQDRHPATVVRVLRSETMCLVGAQFTRELCLEDAGVPAVRRAAA